MKPKRSSWDGVLNVASVAIPLKMAPAASVRDDPFDDGTGLKMACPKCDGAVTMRFLCTHEPFVGDLMEDHQEGHPVSIAREGSNRVWDDGAHRIPITWMEIDNLFSNEGQVMHITEVRKVYSFDPAYIKATYRAWTSPDDEAALASLCRVMDRMQWIAIGWMIMSRRKYLVALRTNGRKHLWVHRLYWPNEVRPSFVAAEDRADPAMVKGFQSALEALEAPASAPLTPDTRNDYAEGLARLLREKAGIIVTTELEASVAAIGK